MPLVSENQNLIYSLMALLIMRTFHGLHCKHIIIFLCIFVCFDHFLYTFFVQIFELEVFSLLFIEAFYNSETELHKVLHFVFYFQALS